MGSDGRAKLAHRNHNGFGPLARHRQSALRHQLGQTLQQVDVGALYDSAYGVAEGAVIDGSAQVVGGAGLPEVGPEIEVHLERLGAGQLLGQHSVPTEEPQPL